MGKFFKEALDGISNIDRTSISDAVNDAYKTIDTLAMYARQKSDSVIENLMKVSPTEMCDFNTRNGVFMLRLMRLNEQEKEITLNALGVDAMFNGDSTAITQSAISPSYAEEMNYKDLFAKNVSSYEKNGQETTRKSVTNGSDAYPEIQNLYPDEDNTATDQFTDDSKWNTTNQNSLLNKTKKLFNQHKINTIISNFHTRSTTPEKEYDVRTKYGLSHGRNLLKKEAEEKGGTYSINGYDDPYCRVWTHHYKYDLLTKMMRPFRDAEGNLVLLKSIHDLKNFKITAENGNVKEWGWKDENDRWNYSVLSDKNGLLNITPKFLGGGEKNIHTKQCMFSIENLAWRDYDPYSFEQALSWEQRGPMGGRIMWFPPYGIQFTENTTTNWNNSTFIGRGEDVYTYVNTVRSGTLNFMMIVDHPSILDYATWYEGSKDKIKDTDIYRFFAGCDPADSSNPNSLLYYAKPTPLTDEYLEENNPDDIYTDEVEIKQPPVEENISPKPPVELIFYVFYPNNYSGVYDWVNGNNTETGTENTGVEAIPYLLFGKGAQMQMVSGSKTTKSIPLNFQDSSLISEDSTGYEMDNQNGMGEIKDNYIVGCTQRWSNLSSQQPYSVVTNSNTEYNKRWYYRIDGEYKTEYRNSKNFYRNCYDQQIPYISRADRKGSRLNLDAEVVKNAFSETGEVFSLAEIASALSSNDNIATKIKVGDFDRVNKLKDEYFNNEVYTVERIVIQGFSNEHGKISNLEKGRNQALADGRAKTVKNWLENCRSEWKDVIEIGDILPSHDIEGGDSVDHSDIEAKKWRSAKVTISLNPTQQMKLSDTDQKPSEYDLEEMSADFEEWISIIEKQIKRIVFPSKEDADENKDNGIKIAINTVLDGNEIQFYKDILNKHKEDFYDLFANSVFGEGTIEVDDEEINNLFSKLKEYLTEDYASTFEDLEDFNSKLGAELTTHIKQLKKYTNVLNNFSSASENIKQQNNKIEGFTNDIEGFVNQINEYYSQINEKNKSVESYETQIGNKKEEMENTTDEQVKKDCQHDIDVLNDKLKGVKKEIEKLNDYIKETNKKIDDSIKKIEDAVKNTNNILSNVIKKNDIEVSQEDYELEYTYTKTDEGNKLIFQQIVTNKKTGKDILGIFNEIVNKIQMPKLEFSDVKGIIKKYIQNKGDIDEYYLNSIVENFGNIVIETTNILIELNNSSFNIIVNFKDDIWKEYNELVKPRANESDKKTRVLQDSLKQAILNMKYSIQNSDARLTELNKNTFANLVNDLESRTLLEDVTEKNKEKFVSLVRNCLETSVWICTDVKSGDYSGLKAEIEEEAEKRQKAINNSQYVGFSKHIAEDGSVYYINENEKDPEKYGWHWIWDEKNQQFVHKNESTVKGRVTSVDRDGNVVGDTNKIRYDQEYYFFKLLKEKNRIGYETLMDKIQYFDPAFHSMTPEGFNARLTFLNQCMRQGNTTTVSDNTVSSANNLAFGRPPYCVLRLGDFYNQMIVIDNISINYDGSSGLQWDLNEEGIGVQPLLANVSISFKFIGGGDLGGPVKRLQNAMSFNYYANASLYDNRADRMEYNWSDKTNGALDENRSLNKDKSVFYMAKNYNNKKK